jgi:hypothetical protein
MPRARRHDTDRAGIRSIAEKQIIGQSRNRRFNARDFDV